MTPNIPPNPTIVAPPTQQPKAAAAPPPEPIIVPPTHDAEGNPLKVEPAPGTPVVPPPEPNPALEPGRVSKFPDIDPAKVLVEVEKLLLAGRNLPKTEVLGRDTAVAVLTEKERPVHAAVHDKAERVSKILGQTLSATVQEVCANAATDPRFDELVSVLQESWAGGDVPPSLKK